MDKKVKWVIMKLPNLSLLNTLRVLWILTTKISRRERRQTASGNIFKEINIPVLTVRCNEYESQIFTEILMQSQFLASKFIK